MINKEKDLEQLHSELTQKLLEKIRDPEVSASELNVARQFLKDNGVESIAIDTSGNTHLAWIQLVKRLECESFQPIFHLHNRMLAAILLC